jgi:hypothetical protein
MAVAAELSQQLQNCGILVPGSLCIPLPGGAEICPPGGIIIPDPSELVLQLFTQLNAALSPLMPFFRVLDVLIAIFDCITAIPKAIFPPNPAPIIQCLVHLSEAIAEVVKLIPVISLPFTVAGFLDALIALLVGVKSNLQSIIDQTARIVAAETAAVGPPAIPMLAQAALCARSQQASEMANMKALFGPVNRLLGVVNLLLSLTGQSPIPTFGDIGDDAEAALASMDPVIQTLQTIRSFIPV